MHRDTQNIEQKNINFDDKKIKNTEFYKNKEVFQIDDIDVNKILFSKKEPFTYILYWI